MSEKVRRLEADVEGLRKDQDDFVTYTHFNAVLDPIRRSLDVVQKDVKEILRVVATPHRSKD